MENGRRRRIETVDGEIVLPEAMIQHIQSFLRGKEAAQTTVLSKSWYSAWLTRPVLDLIESEFRNHGPELFERFVVRTLLRYQVLSLKIDTFRLYTFKHLRRDIALKCWILTALKLGATNIDLELPFSFTLPQEVFRSETLLKLSINGCGVDGNYLISCSRLKFLTLGHLEVIRNDVFSDIISCCNSIEELNLYFSSVLALSLMNLYELPKLCRLHLWSVNVDSKFFSDFASRFPCLKDLMIRECFGCTRIQIASTSLETIAYYPCRELYMAKFDVPNIRKFTYSGASLRHLSIKAASREWEFDIRIDCSRFPKASYFLNLKRLLQKFMLSRISLSIGFRGRQAPPGGSSEHEVDYEVVPDPLVVENLSINVRSSFCSAVMVRLFGIIQPKFVTQMFCQLNNQSDSLYILYKRLMHQVITPNCGIPDQVLFGPFGLKKVNMEVYRMFESKWQPLVLKEPFDPCETPADYGKVRFELIWD